MRNESLRDASLASLLRPPFSMARLSCTHPQHKTSAIGSRADHRGKAFIVTEFSGYEKNAVLRLMGGASQQQELHRCSSASGRTL